MKLERQKKIIELIKNYEIDTQEELALRLKNAGFQDYTGNRFQRYP